MVEDDIPPGKHERPPATKGLETSDKIAMVVAATIIGAGFIIAAVLLKSVITAMIGVSAGVGILGALPIAIGISIVLMIVFGLVAGDAVGELPTMLMGFFLMTGFFTIVIAIIY